MIATLLKCLTTIAAIAPVTGSATAFLVQDERPTCHGQFDISSFTYDCGNRCTFGATIDLAGNRKDVNADICIIIGSALPNMHVVPYIVYSDSGFLAIQNLTLKMCPWNADMACYPLYQLEVDICDALIPLDGQDCPNAGNYTYQMTFNLPGEIGQNWFWGWSMKLEALFMPNLEYLTPTKCFLEVTTIETNNEVVAFSCAGFAIVFATAAALRVRLRRQVVGNNQNNEGIEFQRMKDHVRDSAMV